MKTMVVKRTEGSKRNGKSGGGAHSLKEAAFTTHRTKEEFSVRTFCDSFGVTQDSFTRLTGFSPRAVAHWASGRTPSGSAQKRLTELTRLFDALSDMVDAKAIPIEGPGKGADDCKESLGAEFPGWFRSRFADAIAVTPKTKPGVLAVDLLRREQETIARLSGSTREDTERRLAKLAAAMNKNPLSQAKVIDSALDVLGIGRALFKWAIKVAEAEARRREREADDEGANSVPGIPLSPNAPKTSVSRRSAPELPKMAFSRAFGLGPPG